MKFKDYSDTMGGKKI